MDGAKLHPKIAERVEFIGVPGSGKTTLSAALTAALHAAGERPLAPKDARAVFAQRSLLARLARAAAPQAVGDRAARRLYFWQGGREKERFWRAHEALFRQVQVTQQARPAAARAAERRVVELFHAFARDTAMLVRWMRLDERLIMDEGFAHRVVQFFVSDVEEPDLAAVRAYLRLLPPPSWLVYVHAPHETCLRRVFERGLWQHFEDKDEAQIARFLTNAQTVVETAVAELSRAGWRVIRVENDERPPEATAQDLLRQICAS